RPDHGVTVAELLAARSGDRSLLPRLRGLALPDRWASWLSSVAGHDPSLTSLAGPPGQDGRGRGILADSAPAPPAPFRTCSNNLTHELKFAGSSFLGAPAAQGDPSGGLIHRNGAPPALDISFPGRPLVRKLTAVINNRLTLALI